MRKGLWSGVNEEVTMGRGTGGKELRRDMLC